MRRSSFLQIQMSRLFVLIVLFVFLLSTAAYAETPSVTNSSSQQPQEDQGSLIEELVAAPINGLYSAIQLLGLKGFDELIFNTSYGELAPYSPQEWDIVMTWYGRIRDAVWVLLLIAVAAQGYRFMTSSVNPSKRINFMQSVSSVIYAFFIILFMPYFIRLMFQANNALVDLFHGIAQSMGAVGTTFDINDIKTGNVLATAIVKLGYIGILLYFNFLYLIRKFVLTSMFILTPIVAWSWTISGRKEGIGVVMGEVASNAFMQAAHALVLSLYLVLIKAGVSTDFSPWWAQIFGMVCLIPTANVIRDLLQGWLKFLGVNEEKWAGAATLGLTGLVGLANIAKTAAPPKISLPSGSASAGPTLSSAAGPAAFGVKAGAKAASVGSVVGALAGSAASIPLRTMGVDVTEHFRNIGSFAGKAIAAPSATAGALVKDAYTRGKESGAGFIGGLSQAVGMGKILNERDAAEALGRAGGMILGSAYGYKGIEIGKKIGGAVGRYGFHAVSFITPSVLTSNIDAFRWRS
ncbi:hypothetical protein [Caldanaerobacter subterraneus]|uniref:TrbL/VirB6 plasmid conjugal transfer protein n=1 Tax=Caldanaerobacter subterraneus TaxID=911092 RepID=A0A7Y2L8G0_9THEO|nr:hypothetical protein [Caldanaerobacter subterraneus]NNG67739.1 hypothetical protein [Caldanaerobacter subterraneus]